MALRRGWKNAASLGLREGPYPTLPRLHGTKSHFPTSPVSAKLIVDRETRGILGCHVVGERAVEIAQVASIVISSGMRVDDLAQVPLSFPTYAGVLGRLAASATRQLNLSVSWQANQVEP